MEVLFNDNFDGTGTLVGHSADVGGTWGNYGSGSLKLALGGGQVYRADGYDADSATAQASPVLYIGGQYEFEIEIDVLARSASDIWQDSWAWLNSAGGGPSINLYLSRNGFVRMQMGPTSTHTISGAVKSETKTYTIKMAGAVGDDYAGVYVNNAYVGNYLLNAPMGNDVSVLLNIGGTHHGSTDGYPSLIRYNRITLRGDPYVPPPPDAFWTKVVRAEETP